MEDWNLVILLRTVPSTTSQQGEVSYFKNIVIKGKQSNRLTSQQMRGSGWWGLLMKRVMLIGSECKRYVLCDWRMACLWMASILPVASGAHLVRRHDCNGSYPTCTLSLVMKHREKSRFHNDSLFCACNVHAAHLLGFQTNGSAGE